MIVFDIRADREIEEYTLRGPAADGVRVHDGGIAAASSLLDAGGWVHLGVATVSPDTSAPRHRADGEGPTAPNLAQSGDVVLHYREPVFEVLRGSTRILSRRTAGWSAAAPGPTCARPWGSIELAWVDAGRGLAVVRIDYHGASSDLCWLPDPTLHVVRWP
jgi:hypothetical protein